MRKPWVSRPARYFCSAVCTLYTNVHSFEWCESRNTGEIAVSNELTARRSGPL